MTTDTFPTPEQILGATLDAIVAADHADRYRNDSQDRSERAHDNHEADSLADEADDLIGDVVATLGFDEKILRRTAADSADDTDHGVESLLGRCDCCDHDEWFYDSRDRRAVPLDSAVVIARTGNTNPLSKQPNGVYLVRVDVLEPHGITTRHGRFDWSNRSERSALFPNPTTADEVRADLSDAGDPLVASTTVVPARHVRADVAVVSPYTTTRTYDYRQETR